ncbi:hypothetical protein [Paraburkholderia azotifigens]|uniref:Uncharacterized protein n=1 Tax=Paraburkholderia azotifigens TaxID=2057004 RepID=A0A5C6V332_9BURK|nr:hypothetical protein [Paraburkholderia azotifigens]TXC79091.1 hypothetical protein FRZ40_32205 [Paraburkholderia azotifigens]
MTDATSDSSQSDIGTTLEPHCTVDSLKRHAKQLRSKFSPDKTMKLSHAQTAVVRCIGRAANNVFSGREPSKPTFPAHVKRSEQRDYQRYREIATLTEMFPDLQLAAIIEFVSSWNLVHWREVDPSQSAHGEWSRPDEASPFVGRFHGAALGTTASCVLPEDIDAEGAQLASIVTPTPIDRFMPPTVDFTCEKASALAKIAGTSSPSFAYYVTARVFGYGSWADFEQTFRLGARSQFDEELSPSALTRRRKWQAEALAALFSTDRLAAIELHSFWRPTSSLMNYASNVSRNPAGTKAQLSETKNATRISGKLSAKPRTTA